MCPRNRRFVVLTTGANPKAGRDVGRGTPRDRHFIGLRRQGLFPFSGETELAMAAKNNASPREALTFDDVLIRPGLSEVMPSDVDIRSHITRSISVNIPIVASAMDTVTESPWGCASAPAGGAGRSNRHLVRGGQAAQARPGRKCASGTMV